VDAGVALSHHHGVGQWHAPWFEREAGPLGQRILTTLAADMDPGGTNPHVLLTRRTGCVPVFHPQWREMALAP
jgi:alkyldihydroxyacetonephosphate synthase